MSIGVWPEMSVPNSDDRISSPWDGEPTDVYPQKYHWNKRTNYSVYRSLIYHTRQDSKGPPASSTISTFSSCYRFWVNFIEAIGGQAVTLMSNLRAGSWWEVTPRTQLTLIRYERGSSGRGTFITSQKKERF